MKHVHVVLVVPSYFLKTFANKSYVGGVGTGLYNACKCKRVFLLQLFVATETHDHPQKRPFEKGGQILLKIHTRKER